MLNQAQIKANLDNNAHRWPREYEKSPFKKGVYWFYPCDDHVIRTRKGPDGWTATFHTMRDRETIIHIAPTAPTRAEAVLLMLMKLQNVA